MTFRAELHLGAVETFLVKAASERSLLTFFVLPFSLIEGIFKSVMYYSSSLQFLSEMALNFLLSMKFNRVSRLLLCAPLRFELERQSNWCCCLCPPRLSEIKSVCRFAEV